MVVVTQRIAAWLVQGVVRVLAILPLGVVRLLGRTVGSLLWWSNANAAKVTQINLAHCFPELSDTERRRIAHESLKATAQVAFESGILWYWPDHRWQRLVKGEHGADLLESALANDESALILVPHFGNWEFFALYLGRFEFACLYDPPRLTALEEPMRRSRQRTGGHLHPIGRRGVRALSQALAGGKVAVLLPDQVPEEAGVHATFFGQPAFTMTLVQKLLRRHGSRVFTAAVQRVPGGFDIEIKELDAEALGDEDEIAAATALNSAVAEVVYKDLAQYQWEYKRFKKQPADQPRLYTKDLALPAPERGG